MVVEPPDPPEGAELDVLQGAPRSPPQDDFPVEAADGQPPTVADREILHATAAVTNQGFRRLVLTLVLRRVQCQVAPVANSTSVSRRSAS